MNARGGPSKTQIRKLGERLRAPGEPSTDDLEMLRTFVASHAQSLDAVQVVLVTEFAKNPTNRTKTITTIIDKLRRVPTCTSLQHTWAMTNEGLARRLGRGIQYGERPSRAEDLLDQMLDLSAAIAAAESSTDRAMEGARGSAAAFVHALNDKASPLMQALDEEETLDAALASIQGLLGGLQS